MRDPSNVRRIESRIAANRIRKEVFFQPTPDQIQAILLALGIVTPPRPPRPLRVIRAATTPSPRAGTLALAGAHPASSDLDRSRMPSAGGGPHVSHSLGKDNGGTAAARPTSRQPSLPPAHCGRVKYVGRKKSGTRAKYAETLRLRWLSQFGRVPLAELTRAQLTTHLAALEMAGLKYKTVCLALDVLRTCLNAALQEGHLAINLAARLMKFLTRPPATRAVDVRRLFTESELRTLLMTAEREFPELYPIVLVMARTGLDWVRHSCSSRATSIWTTAGSWSDEPGDDAVIPRGRAVPPGPQGRRSLG